MQSTGYLEIHIKGGASLKKETYDIRDLAPLLTIAEHLLNPAGDNTRPPIALSIESGSVKLRFHTAIAAVTGAASLLAMAGTPGGLDARHPVAKSIAALQQMARKDKTTFEIGTSAAPARQKIVISAETNFDFPAPEWFEDDLFLYGVITDAGGKTATNIHMDVEGLGLVKIAATRALLEMLEDNPLYRTKGIQAKGRRRMTDMSIDPDSIRFVRFLDYAPAPDNDYLEQLIQKGTKNWEGINPDEWLKEVRS